MRPSPSAALAAVVLPALLAAGPGPAPGPAPMQPARQPASPPVETRPAVQSAPPPIYSPFGSWYGAGGKRRWRHYGVDIAVPTGTPVLAAAEGRVVRVSDGPISGLKVVLLHRDGADPLATTYHHLSRIDVKPGDAVARGARVGLSGMTGHASVPHLHFGVCRRPGGRCGDRIEKGWADPVPYLLGPEEVCFRPDRRYGEEPLGLTYPVPCG